MSLLMSSLSCRLYSLRAKTHCSTMNSEIDLGSSTCRTIYSSTFMPKLLPMTGSSPSLLNTIQTRELHYPASSPKSEKERPEFPVRTWMNDRFKLENAYHRKKFYGPDRRFYTKNGLKIIWRKVLKGRHVLHH